MDPQPPVPPEGPLGGDFVNGEAPPPAEGAPPPMQTPFEAPPPMVQAPPPAMVQAPPPDMVQAPPPAVPPAMQPPVVQAPAPVMAPPAMTPPAPGPVPSPVPTPVPAPVPAAVPTWTGPPPTPGPAAVNAVPPTPTDAGGGPPPPTPEDGFGGGGAGEYEQPPPVEQIEMTRTTTLDAPPAEITMGETENKKKVSKATDKAKVVKLQQQRLLLLRHAVKCKLPAGECSQPHCEELKGLWKHIVECKNRKCEVAHCVSSRYVLSHYRRCKDSLCPVCGPVRESIARTKREEKAAKEAQLKDSANPPPELPPAMVTVPIERPEPRDPRLALTKLEDNFDTNNQLQQLRLPAQLSNEYIRIVPRARDKLFPEKIDKTYNGHPAAAWVLLAIAMGTFILGLVRVMGEDGGSKDVLNLPLGTYTEDGTDAIILLLAMWGVSQIIISLIFFLILWRYRSIIPLVYLLLLVEYFVRVILVEVKSVDTTGSRRSPAVVFDILMVPLTGVMLFFSLREHELKATEADFVEDGDSVMIGGSSMMPGSIANPGGPSVIHSLYGRPVGEESHETFVNPIT